MRTKAFLDPTLMRSEPGLSPPNSEKWQYPEKFWVRHIVNVRGPGVLINAEASHRAITTIPSLKEITGTIDFGPRQLRSGD